MKKLMPLFTVLLILANLYALAEAPAVYTSGEYHYRLLEDGTAEIVGYDGEGGALDVPAELDGYRVTVIGTEAFAWQKSLTSVTLPEGINVIRSAAFMGCYNLSSVGLPCGVREIGMEAFSFCYELTDIMLPEGLLSLGDSAFMECESLCSINLPSSLVNVGGGVFKKCINLSSFIVAEDHPVLEVVDGVLFNKATAILMCHPQTLAATVYVVPEGTAEIGDAAFFGCDELITVEVPDTVTVIGREAIASCYYLSRIALPEGVTTIQADAFAYCPNLTDVYLPASIQYMDIYAFDECFSLEVVTVAPGSYAEAWAITRGLDVVYPGE